MVAGWIGAQLMPEPGPEQEPAAQVIAVQLRAPAVEASTPGALRATIPPKPRARAPAKSGVAGAGAARAPVQSLQPRYQVSLPPSASLAFDVLRSVPGAASTESQARVDWQHGGGAYRAEVRVGTSGLELVSEGSTGAAGIIPRSVREKRRNRPATAIHFDAAQGQIVFSASSERAAMEAGTQDKATIALQLAGIARADPGQLEAGIDMLVGEAKGASRFHFTLVGQEQIATALGTLATWRLVRLPPPGSYSPRLDVWLAPDRQWYPVQLRSSETNGVVTTQTINTILFEDAES